jgi:methionine-rich copper-binding protein CopC
MAGRVRSTIVVFATLLALSVPGVTAAHAELAVATPPDGSTVEGPPAEVAGTYTQDLTVDGSSLQLRDANGEVIAKGGVDPNDIRRMVIADLPTLAPGRYEVRWTTASAEDDEVARDTWTFTVTAAPAAAPTATSVPTATPAPTASSPAASAASPDPSAAPTPTPSERPGDQGPGGVGGSDAALPVAAAFAVVAVAAVVLLRRRGRTTPPA